MRDTGRRAEIAGENVACSGTAENGKSRARECVETKESRARHSSAEYAVKAAGSGSRILGIGCKRSRQGQRQQGRALLERRSRLFCERLSGLSRIALLLLVTTYSTGLVWSSATRAGFAFFLLLHYLYKHFIKIRRE